MPSIMAARLHALADLVNRIECNYGYGTVERIEAELGDMDDALYVTLHTTREVEIKCVLHENGDITECGTKVGGV